MTNNDAKATFWEHLDVLRWCVLRSLGVTLVFTIVAFVLKDELFAVIMAPKDPNFITYRLMGASDFNVQLINTGLARQFLVHMQAAFCAGLLCASPYVIYELFHFIAPALYASERRYALGMVGSGYVMFAVGVVVSYYIVFPLTFRFLGTYEVSHEVTNMVSLDSYMDTLLVMSLSMGAVFEMPVLAWLLARMGVLHSRLMLHYHRHAIVAILVAAAFITPTSDVFTLLVVALPMTLLYEASVLIVKCTEKPRQAVAAS